MKRGFCNLCDLLCQGQVAPKTPRDIEHARKGARRGDSQTPMN